MSKLVYICFNNKKLENKLGSRKVFEIMSDRLVPGNITPHPVRVIREDGIAVGIINPAKSVITHGPSVCLGVMMKPCTKWYQPMSPVPDGNYALVRGDDTTIEVVTDIVASRTLWYYYDEDIFIASTSQRAIVMLMGSVSFNQEAVSWMLSSGLLGYGNAWDTRIKKLKGDSRIVLDRRSWEVTIYETPVRFEPADMPVKKAVPRMREVYEDTFTRLNLEPEQWLMALSGGRDSRLVFLLLQDKLNLKCVSWGMKNALHDTLNDAHIAKELAARYGYEFIFREVETKEAFIEDSLTRFLMSGEGRIDNIGPYMDAFDSWKFFFEMDVRGMFRGDQGYYQAAIVNEDHGRKMGSMKLLQDYKEYPDIAQFGFAPQEIHDELGKKKHESLVSYSYRFHHMYRIPHTTAAWNDLVSSYIEVINPLLTRNIIYEIRRLPDHLLFKNKLHNAVVESITPDIHFAKRSAIEPLSDVLYNKHLVKYLCEQLAGDNDREILPGEFLDLVLAQVRSYDGTGAGLVRTIPVYLINTFKKMISDKKKQKLSAYIKNHFEYNKIALRCFIVIKMYTILHADAKALETVLKENVSIQH